MKGLLLHLPDRGFDNPQGAHFFVSADELS